MKGKSFFNKNKLNIILATVIGVAILTIAGLVFNQMYKNHQANQLLIDKYFDNFDEVGEVVVKKDGFWSTVSCEKK